MTYTEIMVRYGELSTKGKNGAGLSVDYKVMSQKPCVVLVI